jgi:hypothetical protein
VSCKHPNGFESRCKTARLTCLRKVVERKFYTLHEGTFQRQSNWTAAYLEPKIGPLSFSAHDMARSVTQQSPVIHRRLTIMRQNLIQSQWFQQKNILRMLRDLMRRPDPSRQSTVLIKLGSRHPSSEQACRYGEYTFFCV